MKNFASDNNSGVHPKIMEALMKVNDGYTIGYGDDKYTRQAEENFKQLFGRDVDVFFVFGGTAANVLGLQSVVNPYNAIICSDEAHINVDECGAPEKFTGAKLLPLKNNLGKINVEQIKPLLNVKNIPHHSKPSVISITQATEMGTVYSAEEIKEISDFAHQEGLALHMDGARIANAVVSSGGDIKEITSEAGVDILSFGGTKNGAMYGEAVIFFNEALVKDFIYYRKQSMQLASKMRYIAAQFSALLENDLWLKNASNANAMAKYLESKCLDIEEIEIIAPVQANSLFVRIPKEIIVLLQERSFFYVWDGEENIVRWMTSFDTEEKDIDDFVESVKELLLRR